MKARGDHDHDHAVQYLLQIRSCLKQLHRSFIHEIWSCGFFFFTFQYETDPSIRFHECSIYFRQCHFLCFKPEAFMQVVLAHACFFKVIVDQGSILIQLQKSALNYFFKLLIFYCYPGDQCGRSSDPAVHHRCGPVSPCQLVSREQSSGRLGYCNLSK